jgi:hypothetical protein
MVNMILPDCVFMQNTFLNFAGVFATTVQIFVYFFAKICNQLISSSCPLVFHDFFAVKAKLIRSNRYGYFLTKVAIGVSRKGHDAVHCN